MKPQAECAPTIVQTTINVHCLLCSVNQHNSLIA